LLFICRRCPPYGAIIYWRRFIEYIMPYRFSAHTLFVIVLFILPPIFLPSESAFVLPLHMLFLFSGYYWDTMSSSFCFSSHYLLYILATFHCRHIILSPTAFLFLHYDA
jgi:hypothetical protein